MINKNSSPRLQTNIYLKTEQTGRDKASQVNLFPSLKTQGGTHLPQASTPSSSPFLRLKNLKHPIHLYTETVSEDPREFLKVHRRETILASIWRNSKDNEGEINCIIMSHLEIGWGLPTTHRYYCFFNARKHYLIGAFIFTKNTPKSLESTRK